MNSEYIRTEIDRVKYSCKPYKMCKYMLQNGICKSKNCPYNHDIRRYKPLECKNFYTCEDWKCPNLHVNENYQTYIKRFDYLTKPTYSPKFKSLENFIDSIPDLKCLSLFYNNKPLSISNMIEHSKIEKIK